MVSHFDGQLGCIYLSSEEMILHLCNCTEALRQRDSSLKRGFGRTGYGVQLQGLAVSVLVISSHLLAALF